MPRTTTIEAIKQFAFYWKQSFLSLVIKDEEAREYFSPGSFEMYGPKMVENMAGVHVVQMVHHYLSMEVERVEFEVHETWWDMFKDKYFPEWAKDRWPVRKKLHALTSEVAILKTDGFERHAPRVLVQHQEVPPWGHN